MNPISVFSSGMADLAGFAQPVISFLRGIAESAGLTIDDSPDSWSGILTSGAAGVAAALAVALTLTVYFRSRHRTVSDIARHGLAAVVVLGLLAFVAYDLRDAALAYLGMNPSKPEVEFEIRLPKTAASAVADTQIELHTDRNQRLAQIERELAPGDDGRSVLRGWVPLDFRTTDRVVILNPSPVNSFASSNYGWRQTQAASVSSAHGILQFASARAMRPDRQRAERRLRDPLPRALGINK